VLSDTFLTVREHRKQIQRIFAYASEHDPVRDVVETWCINSKGEWSHLFAQFLFGTRVPDHIETFQVPYYGKPLSGRSMLQLGLKRFKKRIAKRVPLAVADHYWTKCGRTPVGGTAPSLRVLQDVMNAYKAARRRQKQKISKDKETVFYSKWCNESYRLFDDVDKPRVMLDTDDMVEITTKIQSKFHGSVGRGMVWHGDTKSGKDGDAWGPDLNKQAQRLLRDFCNAVGLVCPKASQTAKSRHDMASCFILRALGEGQDDLAARVASLPNQSAFESFYADVVKDATSPTLATRFLNQVKHNLFLLASVLNPRRRNAVMVVLEDMGKSRVYRDAVLETCLCLKFYFRGFRMIYADVWAGRIPEERMKRDLEVWFKIDRVRNEIDAHSRRVDAELKKYSDDDKEEGTYV